MSANLFTVAKVIGQKDLLETRSAFVAFKQATAYRTFFERDLDGLLRSINNETVQCGCPRCTAEDIHNYPEDEENKEQNEYG